MHEKPASTASPFTSTLAVCVIKIPVKCKSHIAAEIRRDFSLCTRTNITIFFFSFLPSTWLCLIWSNLSDAILDLLRKLFLYVCRYARNQYAPGTSFVTTEPAATIEFLPMVMPSIMIEPCRYSSSHLFEFFRNIAPRNRHVVANFSMMPIRASIDNDMLSTSVYAATITPGLTIVPLPSIDVLILAQRNELL